MIRIITDSTSGMGVEEASRLGITIVPCELIWDGKEYRDGIDLSIEEFYERLAVSSTLPTTSQPTPDAFLQAIDGAKAAGEEALILTLSSRLSGAYRSACAAKNMAEGVAVEVVDTLNTILGERILLEAAAAHRDRPLAEVKELIESLIPRIRSWAVVDTLKYLHKGGRLSAAGALVGSILHIKPVLSVSDGVVRMEGKAAGSKKAMHIIADLVKAHPMDAAFPVYYGYAAKTEKCELLIDAVAAHPEAEKQRMFPISPVIGVHVGPDACIVSYVEQAETV